MAKYAIKINKNRRE